MALAGLASFSALVPPNLPPPSDAVLCPLCSVAKLDEVELFLHGLDLGHLADIMAVSVDITHSFCVTLSLALSEDALCASCKGKHRPCFSQ